MNRKQLTLIAVLLAAPILGVHAATPSDDEQAMARMHEHIQHMDEVMARINASSDEAEASELMAEHMAVMQEGMTMMKQMMAMEANGSDPAHQHKVIGDRLNVMEQMMNQMVQHQEVEQRHRHKR